MVLREYLIIFLAFDKKERLRAKKLNHFLASLFSSTNLPLFPESVEAATISIFFHISLSFAKYSKNPQILQRNPRKGAVHIPKPNTNGTHDTKW